MAILQTAANPYVTILGPLESAARRMSIMGICNGIAGVIGPLALGSVILKDADGIRERVARMASSEKVLVLGQLAHRAILPYGIIALLLLGLASWIYYSSLPELHDEEEEAGQTHEHHRKTSIFQFPHLLLGVLTLFLYVGVEVIAGDTIISYGTSQGFRMSTAKFFTSYTLAGMLAGYLLGIVLIPKYISHTRVLKISSLMGLAFGLAALFTRGGVSVAFIALLGFANSMVWPSIWPLAIQGLGKFTRIGSSLLILAIGGGALLPMLYGWLADHFSPQQAYWVVAPCYCFIGYYAFYGHKVRA